MKKKREKILYFLVLMWVGISQLYWQLVPRFMDYQEQSLKNSFIQIVKGLTAIGPNVLILLLGACLSWRLKNVESQLIKVWLNTFVVGSLLCLTLAIFSTENLTQPIYDAILPIARNSYPIISGVLLGMIIGPATDQLSIRWQRITLWLILSIITIGTLFTPSIYGWSENNLSIFYSLIFVLGWLTKQNGLVTWNKKIWLLVGLVAFILNLCLEAIMPWLSLDGTTVSRYSTSTDILIVIVAMAIVRLLPEILDLSLVITFTFLTLSEATGISVFLNNTVVRAMNGAATKVGILVLLTLLIILVLSYLWQYILRIPKLQCLNEKITNFTEHSFTKQVVIVKITVYGLLPNILAFGVSYLIALISMLMVNDSFTVWAGGTNGDYNIFAYALGKRELLLLLTAIIVFSAIKFIQAIINRYWVSLAIVVIFNIIFIIGNYIKIQARFEPVLPADLSAINTELLKMVDRRVYMIALIAIIIIIFFVVFLELHHPVKIRWSWSYRFIYIIGLPILLTTSFFWNQPGPIFNLLRAIDDEPTFYSQLDGAKRNGPTLQFLNNVDLEVMTKPMGYSAETMKQLVYRYQSHANQLNRIRSNNLGEQTIIFNLSESFANPERVPGIKLTHNPIPYITKMTHHTTGGLMLSSGYGGGTANMEYMTLTGYSLSNFLPMLSVPYTQLVTKLETDPSIIDNFKYAVSIHPYYGVFYSRIAVYKKFGFNRFMYLGGKDKIKHLHYIDRSPYLSDRTAYENTLDQIKDHQKGQFINLITMQNHLPFDQNYYNNSSKYRAAKVSKGTDKASVDDYITGIHYTDKYVEQFIKQIDQLQKPITIVFYGDHLPGIYGNSMKKDGQELHETDYFIYSNRYARQHGAKPLKQNVNYTDPNNFIAMVAKQTNSKVNWYQALLTDVYEKLPAVTVNFTQSDDSKKDRNEFINQKGKIVSVKSFTKKQRQIWHDYQLVQYDVTAGHHYVLKYLK